MAMSKHVRTKLATRSVIPEKRMLETKEEPRLEQQEENPMLSELDTEIECPRCNEIMELHSKFDELVYLCNNCNFLLKFL